MLFDAKETAIKADRKNLDYQEIFNYRLAINRGRDLLEKFPISENYVKKLHKILLNSVRGQNRQPGEFRDHQVFIGPYGATIEQATYIPPAPSDIVPLFSNLEKYLNTNDDSDPLFKIAVAHYQFEAIHPFSDGNGRVGRLLIPLFLYEKKVTSYPNIYISEYLEKNRDIYYRLLREVSEKEAWLPWLNFFLEAVCQQTTETFAKVGQIEALHRELSARMPAIGSIYADRFLEFIFTQPIFTTTSLKKSKMVEIKSARTLYSLINKFIELGIIKDLEPELSRGKVYSFVALKRIIGR
jgi:Fic family protein